MEKQPEMQFAGPLLRLADPAEAGRWFSQALGLSLEGEGSCLTARSGDCRIFLERDPDPAPAQTAAEGYYTGLAHIALRSTDLPASVRLCTERGARLAGAEQISYNPGIWGTGMDYVNPLCPFGVGMEISQRLDLPAGPMEQATDGLEHIGIPVAQIEESVAWYRSLGFEKASGTEIHREDGAQIFCVMMSGYGVILELFEFAGMAHEPMRGQPFAALVFETGAPADWQAFCAARGIPCEKTAEGLALTGPCGETLLLCER